MLTVQLDGGASGIRGSAGNQIPSRPVAPPWVNRHSHCSIWAASRTGTRMARVGSPYLPLPRGRLAPGRTPPRVDFAINSLTLINVH